MSAPSITKRRPTARCRRCCGHLIRIRHSFPQRELKKLDEEQSSQFYGIGVSILQHRDGVYVQSIVPGTPADKAGLRYGDRSCRSTARTRRTGRAPRSQRMFAANAARRYMCRSSVSAARRRLNLISARGGVPLPSIRNYFMLPNGVGYVGLTGGFQQTTSEELTEAINELKKRGMKSLILDLRGNPGRHSRGGRRGRQQVHSRGRDGRVDQRAAATATFAI